MGGKNSKGAASKQGSKIQENQNQNQYQNQNANDIDPTEKRQPAGRGNKPVVDSQPVNGNEVNGEQPPISTRRSHREDPEIAKERKNYDREDLEQKMKRTKRTLGIHVEQKPILERGRPYTDNFDNTKLVEEVKKNYKREHFFPERKGWHWDDIEFLEKLYEDRVDGQVWRAQDLKTNKYMNIKVMLLADEFNVVESRKVEDFSIEDKIYEEIAVGQRNHPNICDKIDVTDDLLDDGRRIICIRSEAGVCTLHDMLEIRFHEHGTKGVLLYKEEEIAHIFEPILDGMNYLMSKGIFHRNVHPYNMILNNDLNDYQLGQFTVAAYAIKPQINTLKMGGATFYMEPKVERYFQAQAQPLAYDIEKCDVYSVGISMLETMGVSEVNIKKLRGKDLKEAIDANEYSLLAEDYPKLLPIVEGMVSRESDSRPGFVSLLEQMRKLETKSKDFTERPYRHKVLDAQDPDKMDLKRRVKHFRELSNIYLLIKQYDKCIFSLEDLLKALMERDGHHNTEDAEEAHFEMGWCYYCRNNHNESVEWFEKDRKILTKIHPTREHKLWSRNYKALGALYLKSKEYDKSLTNYQSAESLDEKLLKSSEHPDLWEVRNCIGICYYSMDKYKAAQQKHRNSLELLKRKYNNDNEDHEDLSNVTHNLALDCFCLGNFEEAEQSFNEELRVKRKFYGGEDHKEIAGVHNNLGMVKTQLGDYDGAIREYEASIEIKKKIYGTINCMKIAKSIHNIAECYNLKGEHERAYAEYKRSLDIKKLVKKTEETPEYCNGLNCIGILHQDKKEFDEAIEVLEKSKKIQESNISKWERMPVLAQTYSYLADVYSQKGDQVKSNENLEKLKKLNIDPEENPGLNLSNSFGN